MSRIVRPAWDTFIGGVRGYVACACGQVLQTVEATRAHWSEGHFDTLLDDSPEGLAARVVELETVLRTIVATQGVILQTNDVTLANIGKLTESLGALAARVEARPARVSWWRRLLGRGGR